MKTVHANPPEKICRLCLSDSGVILPIFEGEVAERFPVPLPQKILSCLSIKVCADDPLPPHICHRCLFEVDRFHEFRETCKRTNTTFNKICNNTGDIVSFDVTQVLEIKQELHDESIYHDAISELLSDDEGADIGSSRLKKRNRCLSLLESMKRVQQAHSAASAASAAAAAAAAAAAPTPTEQLSSEWTEQAKTTTNDTVANSSCTNSSLECRFCAKPFAYERSLLEHEELHAKGVVTEEENNEHTEEVGQVEHVEPVEPMEQHPISHEPLAGAGAAAPDPSPATASAAKPSSPAPVNTPVLASGPTAPTSSTAVPIPLPCPAPTPIPVLSPVPSLTAPSPALSTAAVPGTSLVLQQAMEAAHITDSQDSLQPQIHQVQAPESGSGNETAVETVSLTDVTAMLLEGAFEGVRPIASQTATLCRYCQEPFNNPDLLKRHERLYCNRKPSFVKFRQQQQKEQPHQHHHQEQQLSQQPPIQPHSQNAHQASTEVPLISNSQPQHDHQTHHLMVHQPLQMSAQHADQSSIYNQKVVVETTSIESTRSCKHCHKDFIHRGSLWRHQLFCDANPERDLNRMVAGSKRKPASIKSCDLRSGTQAHIMHEPAPLPISMQSAGVSQLRRSAIQSSTGPFKCKFCEKRFLHRGSWWRHQKMFCSVNPEIPTVKAESKVRHNPGAHSFACRYCERTFLHRGSCWHHEQTHTGLKEHGCRYCSKTFNEKSRLARHERMHLGIKPFSCRQCGKAFCDASNLRNHEQIHGERASFLCAWCGKSYTRRALLLKHEQVHAGEGQIFTCTSCPRTFPDPDLLREHALCHSQLKKRLYLCQACGQSFRSQNLLSQHNQQSHPHVQHTLLSQQVPQQSQHIQQASHSHQGQEQPHHLCRMCSKPFPDVPSLRHHELLHNNTSKEYCCPNIGCNAVFHQESQLDAHLLMHENHKVPSSVNSGSSSNYHHHRHSQQQPQQQLIPAHEIPQQVLPHHEILQREGTYVLEAQDISGQTVAVHHLVNQIPQ